MPRSLLLAILFLFDAVPASAQADRFGGCPSRPADVGVRRTSLHVAAPDGTRLAVDLMLPDPLPTGTRLSAVTTFTRYWRSAAGRPTSPRDADWVRHGYAVVHADVRGTGASFGTWRRPWSDVERDDIATLLGWVAAQPWSNGRIVSTGGSYLGNTAQLAALTGVPAVRAVAPVAFDHDLYGDLVYPGGIPNRLLLREWSALVAALDANEAPGGGAGVRPVDGPDGPSLLAAAVMEHRGNARVDDATRGVAFRDDVAAAWGVPFDAIDLRRFRAAADAAAVPVQGWASWLDAGTANGVLSRFLEWKVPQEAIIGPWSHGGRWRTDPFSHTDTATAPSAAEQREAQRCFFDARLANAPVAGTPLGGAPVAGALATPRRVIRYFTMGEDRWHETATWPPRGMRPVRWYVSAGQRLERQGPPSRAGSDRYVVDTLATTGPKNRWATQLDAGPVDYGDRSAADARLLTYTSAPLARAVEVTGHPILSLALRASTTDGNVFAYLEAVSPEGRVVYLTEGQLRLSHRREVPGTSVLPVPHQTHRRADAAPMVPGEVTRVRVGLLPTSVRVPAGWRLRVAIGGADAGTFDRWPQDAVPEYVIERNAGHASWIEIPMRVR